MTNGIMRWPARLIELRARVAHDERGAAMVLVLTFMIFIVGITVATTSILINQGPAVYQAERGSQTVYAAQSGMQVALGQIRTASGTGGLGDITKLPCTIEGGLGGSEAARYSVTVRYYTVDPSDKTQTWRNAASNYKTCKTLSSVPRYALLTATGTGASVPGIDDSVGNRTLQAVYTFRVTNINIPGGLISNFDGTHCLKAVKALAGQKIQFAQKASCTDASLVTWVYDTSWRLRLASTIGTANELCIAWGTTNQAQTVDAVLEKCKGSSDSQRWNQLWNWSGNYAWEGEKKDLTSYLGCLAATDDSKSLTNQYLQVRANGCTTDFSPDSKVGAGGAGKSTNQIVNYKEFGRCLDVTDADINKTFMIAYPCKQDASGNASFDWNHKWYYDEPTGGAASTDPQTIRVRNGSTWYCLQSAAKGVSPSYPVFKSCNGAEAKQKWIRHQDAGSYSTSYLFTDYDGRCLQVAPADLYRGWSKIVVGACDGSLEQKWNAPSETTDSTLGSFREIG